MSSAGGSRNVVGNQGSRPMADLGMGVKKSGMSICTVSFLLLIRRSHQLYCHSVDQLTL